MPAPMFVISIEIDHFRRFHGTGDDLLLHRKNFSRRDRRVHIGSLATLTVIERSLHLLVPSLVHLQNLALVRMVTCELITRGKPRVSNSLKTPG